MASEWETGLPLDSQPVSKVGAIAIVISVVGILIGSFGVYVGWTALNKSENLEEIVLRPNLDIRVLGGIEKSSKRDLFFKVVNSGFGPAVIKSIELKRGKDAYYLSDASDGNKKNYFKSTNSILDLGKMKPAGSGVVYRLHWFGADTQLAKGAVRIKANMRSGDFAFNGPLVIYF